MNNPAKPCACWGKLLSAMAAAGVPIALAVIFFVAPTEQTMGDAQRIVYIHVAMAWLALAGFIVTAAGGAMYLLPPRPGLGPLVAGGSRTGLAVLHPNLGDRIARAHAAWNTWWTWEPRLAASFVLWTMYCGYLLIRGSLDDPHRSARLGAVLALVGLLDVPLVVMATRWFRGVHPQSPGMEPRMRLALLAGVVGFTAFFTLLLVLRRTQLREELLDNLNVPGTVPIFAATQRDRENGTVPF